MEKRKIVQLLTLVLFAVLIVIGKIQLWMAIFGVSLLLSTYFGRFYCGYICPINTAMELIDDNAEKKKRKRNQVPKVFKNPIIRYAILILFLGAMVIVFKTGKKLPVLPILFGSGIIITIFYKPEFWHRYLCPYGALLSIFSRLNKKTYMIHNESCIKCGKCVDICPSDAIAWDDKKAYPIIIKNECLQCGKCIEVCPTDSIR
ncbi:MAG: 4Fe-4S binding protein [Tissierellaceae bacterium]|nr:4Fe-4S binding protein [Tissierellaceae bacterium]